MIKIFRNFRSKLLGQNKSSKYLIYAIGEIILVVIGILIALQINIWNENRKQLKVEKIILNDIKNDLIQTKEDLLNNEMSHKKQILIYKQLLSNIETTKIYHDSLSTKFGELIYWDSPYLTTASYENLKLDKGIDIISSEGLKKKIVDLHERTFQILIGDVEREEWIYTENVSRPNLFKYFYFISRKKVEPKDYNELLKNPDYSSFLYFTIELRERSLEATQANISEIQDVIDAISKELN